MGEGRLSAERIMTATNLNEYIQQNEQSRLFLQNYPELCADSFFKFEEEYYKKMNEKDKSAGSKFSERVFTQWIYNVVKDLSPTLIPQAKLELASEGVQKQIDLHLMLRNKDHFLIEFKCNIDMIEKDIFKFIYLKQTNAKKLMFIWESVDSSRSRHNDFCSYIKILDFFKKNNGIEYFYFPLWQKNGKTYLKYDAETLQKNIDYFINYLRCTNSNAT
jgi:hypothetical protein